MPTLTTCTTKLPAKTSCAVAISFTPTASGSQPGALTATVSNLGVAPLVIPLAGNGLAVGGIQTAPTQMTFGSVTVGATSAMQSLTVTNTGSAALAGLTISATGDFLLVNNACATTLAAGSNCTVGVEFLPSVTGSRTGTLTVSSSSADVSPAVVPLTGNGIPSGSLAVNPPVLSYGTVTVGQTSPAQTVTITNNGATALTGLSYQLAGDYSLAQNSCGALLAGGAVCSFAVSFSPSAPGTRIGSVTIQSTTAGFTPVVIGLTGTGLPTVQLTVTPPQLAFGAVAVGSNSTALQLTVSNPGTGILQGLSLTTTAPFSVGSASCGTTILPGGTCEAPVIFSPSVGGSQNGVVTIATTSLGVPPVQIPLSGTGQAPAALNLSPSIVTFSGTAIGVVSAAQTITVSNPGGLGLSGLSLYLSGAASADFAIASTSCSATLAPGASCSAAVTFKPSVAGGRQGFLTASSTTQGVSNAVTDLNGTGLTTAALTIAPSQLTFAATPVGQVSATQTMTIANSGQAGIANLQLATTPGFTLDPTQTTCTAILNGGASCQAGILFSPTTGGAITGSITASSALASGSIAVTAPLSGIGAVPATIVTLPAALVQFGTTGVGQAAQPVQVTVTNPGTLSALTGLMLTVNAAGATDGFALSGNTCGATLAAGASCTANVTFTPTGYGPLAGALTISSNGVNSVSLQLDGIGFDFQLAVLGTNSISVVQGQTANYTLALTTLGGPQGASGANVSFACGNLPANSLCVFNPTQLPVPATNITGNVALGISTGAPSAASLGRSKPWHSIQWRSAAMMIAALLLLPVASRTRNLARRQFLLLAIVLAGFAIGLTSCVGSGGATGSGGQSHLGGGTPSGSYTVPVSATANGVVHNAMVTLIVD